MLNIVEMELVSVVSSFSAFDLIFMVLSKKAALC